MTASALDAPLEPLAEDDDLVGEVVPIQEATSSYDCKRPNCVEQAKTNRGRYAYLCHRHTEEQRTLDRAEAARGASGAPGAPPAESDAPSLVQTVKALEKPARRLEAALGRRKLAREEARQAVDEFNAALRAVRELATQLLA